MYKTLSEFASLLETEDATAMEVDETAAEEAAAGEFWDGWDKRKIAFSGRTDGFGGSQAHLSAHSRFGGSSVPGQCFQVCW